MIKIILVVGTRPSFIMASRLINNLDKHKKIKLILVHTGQHFSKNMDNIFFKELKIRRPDKRLIQVPPKNTIHQLSSFMNSFNNFVIKKKPNKILVLGDTNSNLSCALVARKLNIFLGHIEAGQRSLDLKSPEEQNRIIIDHLADINFCTNKFSKKNLLLENISKKKIFITGHPITEVIKFFKKKKYCAKKNYIFSTIHRAENCENKTRLKNIISNINIFCSKKKIICYLTLHPRLLNALNDYKISFNKFKHICFIKPVSFYKTQNYILNSSLVLTDSGGLQQEAYLHKKNCITLMENTAWPETLANNCNKTITNFSNFQTVIEHQYNKKRKFKNSIFGNNDFSKKVISFILK
jgi:UDP-GlcNAc3NAcA epimerase